MAGNLEDKVTFLHRGASKLRNAAKTLYSGSLTAGLAYVTSSIAGYTPLLLATGFNLGNYFEKKKVKKRMVAKDIKAETVTGLITGVMHNSVYQKLKSIAIDNFGGILGRGLGVLTYTIPYVFMTKGINYLAKNYTAMRVVKELAVHPYKTLKDVFAKGIPNYWSTIGDVWKKMGLPLVANINFAPDSAKIPISVGLGAWYRRIRGKREISYSS